MNFMQTFIFKAIKPPTCESTQFGYSKTHNTLEIK